MPLKYFLPFLFLISSFAQARLQAQVWKKSVLINSCRIMDLKGEPIKAFPGNLCQFMEDGSYLSANESSLKYLDKNNAVIWQKVGIYHHQLNLSPDKKRILILNNAPISVKGKPFVEDLFQVADFSGKILHQAYASEYLKQINRKNEIFSDIEITHFNSFYEIPPMNPDLKLPDYIKPGNFILNAYALGIFVVSADLKKVLHFQMLENSIGNHVHDVQILPSGKMIYFNNDAGIHGSGVLHSSIDELDFTTGKTQTIFSAQPKEMFFSLHCGGVQQLDDDHVLFSHMLAGTYIYSLKDKKILSNIYKTHLQGNRFYPAQQVKAQDLSKFLSHWK